MLRVILRPAAEADLQDAYDWYERRQPGLGVEFIGEIDRCISNIVSEPKMYPVVHKSVRQAPVRRFPYCVMYSVLDEEIVVFATFPAARDPKVWRGRL
jgi:plasmid stabilization system protein ParE